eukprot:6180196-Pleurochrysis_carterae.AAC.3
MQSLAKRNFLGRSRVRTHLAKHRVCKVFARVGQATYHRVRSAFKSLTNLSCRATRLCEKANLPQRSAHRLR